MIFDEVWEIIKKHREENRTKSEKDKADFVVSFAKDEDGNYIDANVWETFYLLMGNFYSTREVLKEIAPDAKKRHIHNTQSEVSRYFRNKYDDSPIWVQFKDYQDEAQLNEDGEYTIQGYFIKKKIYLYPEEFKPSIEKAYNNVKKFPEPRENKNKVNRQYFNSILSSIPFEKREKIRGLDIKNIVKLLYVYVADKTKIEELLDEIDRENQIPD